MNRPKILHIGGTLYWVLRTRNPDTQVLKDADSTPTVVVRKNGASTGDSVTITKRSATTGIYDCSYNPASEIEGDEFTVEESAAVTGTTTSSATYTASWECTVVAIERGTNFAAADIRAAIGMSAADLDTQLDAILAAASAGAGSGGRTVTITVNDGTTVLENAIVRMTEGVNSFRALTNVSGVAVFNLDDATHTVSITKSGYTYAGTTIVVNGTETATYSMTAITITPGAGDLTTGWLVTRVAGVATEDITIRYQQRQEPASDTGSSYDDTIYSVESDADGLVELAMVRGAYYYVWRGTGKRPELAQLLLIPANAGATYELPSHVGH